MMGTLTRVPEAVDALVALFGDATGLQVLDGPTLGQVMHEAICVGLSSEQSRPGYDVEVIEQPGLGRTRYVERWTVSSLLTVSSGDTDMGALRSRAGEVLAQVDGALRAAPVVRDLWQRVALSGAMQWLPLQHPEGATVSVFFDVVGESIL